MNNCLKLNLFITLGPVFDGRIEFLFPLLHWQHSPTVETYCYSIPTICVTPPSWSTLQIMSKMQVQFFNRVVGKAWLYCYCYIVVVLLNLVTCDAFVYTVILLWQMPLNYFLNRSKSDECPSRRQKTDTPLGYVSHPPRSTSPSPCLKVHPRSRYGQGAAVLRKPMFLGDFSLDEQRHFCHDQRNLHFIPMDWTGNKKVLTYVCAYGILFF